MNTVQDVPGLLTHALSFVVSVPLDYHEVLELQVVNKSFRAAVSYLPEYMNRVHLNLRTHALHMSSVARVCGKKLVRLHLGNMFDDTYHTLNDTHLATLVTHTPNLSLLHINTDVDFTTSGLASLNLLSRLTHLEIPMGHCVWPVWTRIVWLSVVGNTFRPSFGSNFMASPSSPCVTKLSISRLRRVTCENMVALTTMFPSATCFRIFDCTVVRSYDPLIFNSERVLAWTRNLTAFFTVHSDLLPMSYTAFRKVFTRVFPKVTHFGTNTAYMMPVDPCAECECISLKTRVVYHRCTQCVDSAMPGLKYVIRVKC